MRKASLELELMTVVVNSQMYRLKTHPYGFEGQATGDVKKIVAKVVVGGTEIAKRLAKSGTAMAVITPGNQVVVQQGALMEFYLAEDATLPALTAPVNLD